MFQLFLIHLCIMCDVRHFSYLWASLTIPAFRGVTLGAVSSVKMWVSQLPTSQAGQWSLVVKEKIATNEMSPSTLEIFGK